MRRSSLLLFVAVFAVLVAAAVRAQETAEVPTTSQAPSAPAPAPAPEAVPAPPPEAEPIPLPEIAAKAEAVNGFLREARARLEPDKRVTAIETQLPKVAEELHGRRDALGELLASGSSLDALRDFEREIRVQEEQLASWRRLLTMRIAELEGPLARIDLLQERWKRTREAATAVQAPASVLESVQGVLSSLRDVEKQLKSRRRVLLTVQNEIGKEELGIAEATEAVRAAERAVRGRLFERDGAPLWTALRQTTQQSDGLWPPVASKLARDLDQVRSYVRERSDRILLHAFILVALLALTLTLQGRVRRWDEDPELQPSRSVVSHPVASALLVSLIVAPWLYPLAPAAFQDLLGLLLLIPVLVLLPGLVEHALRPAIFGLSAFYVVDRFRDLLDGIPLAERVMFVFEVGAALGLVAWMMRPARLAQVPRHVQLPRALGVAIRTAMGLLVISLIANLTGFLSLSRLLGEGVLTSTYVGVVLYAAVRVTRALIRLFVRSARGQGLGMVRTHGALVFRRVARVLDLGALLAWALFTLELFAVREPLGAMGSQILATSVHFGAIEISVGNVLGFAATILAAVYLSRLLRFVLDEDVLPRMHLGRGVPHAISATVHYSILLFGFFLALGAAGIDLNRFTLLAGAFGVGIGFGLQNVVNNFVSGLILLFERPVQVGDTIELGPVTGEIKRIGIRSSTVRTWQGAEVIVPNSNLISEQLVNWTLSDRMRRLEIPVGVAYGTDPERVLEILRSVASAHADVLPAPAPVALFRGFGDSSLDFELRCWTSRFEAFLAIFSDLSVGINRALSDAGITIPFPQRDLHLQTLPPALERAISGPKGS